MDGTTKRTFALNSRAANLSLTTLLFAIPTALFIILVLFQQTTFRNVPVGDDYYAILKFLLSWIKETGYERLTLIFAPHNEHVIAVTRLFSLFDHYAFDGLNFKRMAFYAALALPLIYYAILMVSVDKRLFAASVFIAAFLIFRPEDWKYLEYPMANISALWGMAFVASFFVSIPGRNNATFGLALIFLLLALCTDAAAFLALPIGVAFLVMHRRWKHLAIFLFVSVIFVGFYSHQSAGTESPVGNFLSQPWVCIRFGIALAGSTISAILPLSKLGEIAVGLTVISVAVWIILRDSPYTNAPAKMVLIYCLGANALIGAARGPLYADAWWTLALDGRYRVYSVVIVALIFLTAARYERIWSRFLLTCIALAACIASYMQNYRPFSSYANGYQSIVENVVRTGSDKRLSAAQIDILKSAIQSGIYKPDLPL